jgi:hypothetical protein
MVERREQGQTPVMSSQNNCSILYFYLKSQVSRNIQYRTARVQFTITSDLTTCLQVLRMRIRITTDQTIAYFNQTGSLSGLNIQLL